MRQNLVAADAALAQLGRQAVAWNQVETLSSLRSTIADQLATAAAAYDQLGSAPTAAALQEFMATHRNAPQALQASMRLEQLDKLNQAFAAQLDRYRQPWPRSATTRPGSRRMI